MYESHYSDLASLMLSPIPATHPVAFSQDTTFDWSDFKRRTIDLIALLEERPEHRVAICYKDSYLFAIALMAALYAKKTHCITR